MLSISEKIIVCLAVILFASHGFAQTNTDIIHYSVTVEPDIEKKSVTGSVFIRVRTTSNVVEFNCGDLTIESVQEDGKALQVTVNDHKLRVSLGEQKGERELEVKSHGAPRRWIRFFLFCQQVYPIFSTSQW